MKETDVGIFTASSFEHAKNALSSIAVIVEGMVTEVRRQEPQMLALNAPKPITEMFELIVILVPVPQELQSAQSIRTISLQF